MPAPPLFAVSEGGNATEVFNNPVNAGDEGSAAFKPGTCHGGTYTGTGMLTESGAVMRNRIRTPDTFPTG
ncbi:hypothetical protein [Micromonospora sp. KC723]|uniref:hypothetical protein n=1 Tax=Micromonospora sp. KC723 TaxID=2530381 RepID=UPI001052C263|nr:hypothetical protein [Micromonospora sp. KC723]TDB74038.1 hypothetical protein E1165_15670 [Micromonospora sp. KC723]